MGKKERSFNDGRPILQITFENISRFITLAKVQILEQLVIKI